jgi:intracellular septation protein
MRLLGLFFSLLWRTFVLQVALSIIGLLALRFSEALGVPFIPPEVLETSRFILLKPTIIYWGVALALLVALLIFRINLVRAIAGRRLALTDAFWFRFVIGLAAILGLLGLLNWLVAISASVETWITFKLFGGLSILLSGIALLVIGLARAERPHP